MKILFMYSFLFYLVSCATAPVPQNSKDLKVKDMPVLHSSPNIFATYNKSGKSLLANSWVKQFDASGIAFNNSRAGTLVTPSHVVVANHYQHPVGATLVFHDRQGNPEERVIVARKHAIGDCAVALLDTPLPANYMPYSLLKHRAGLEGKLRKEFVLVTDKNRRLFVHQVGGFRNNEVMLNFNKKEQIGYGKTLVKGDSGNPAFVMVGGKPVLLETHSKAGSNGFILGVFYGHPEVQSALEKAITELGGKGKVSYVNWPH